MSFGKLKFKIVLFAILFAVLSFGALLRFDKPQFPLFVPDSGAYISSAIQYFLTGELRGNCARSFPYPYIILLIMKLFGNLNFIPLFQHISGLFAGALLFFTLDQQIVLQGSSKVLKRFFYLIVFFCIFVFLTNNEFINYYEQTINPEGFISFFYAVVVFLAVRIFTKEIQKKTTLGEIQKNSMRSKTVRFFVEDSFFWHFLLNVINAFIFLYQPKYGFVLLVFPFFSFIVFIIKKKWIKFLGLSLLVLISVVPFYSYESSDKEISCGKGGVSFFPINFFAWHADIIRFALNDDLKDPKFTAYDKSLVSEVLSRMEIEFNRQGPKSLHYIGFSPENIGWGENSPAYFAYLYFGKDGKLTNDFYQHYNKKSVFQYTGLYIKRILIELKFYYSGEIFFTRQSSFRYQDWSNLVSLYATTHLESMKGNKVSSMFQRQFDHASYFKDNFEIYNSMAAVVLLKDRWLVQYASRNLSVLILFLIVLSYRLIDGIRSGNFQSEFTFVFLPLSFYLITFVANLSIATVGNLLVNRYVDGYFYVTILTQGSACIYIASSLTRTFPTLLGRLHSGLRYYFNDLLQKKHS